ncbi:pleckstrin homology domain-containing family O member 2 [Octodon degus]|uniref:Pleckstrin homology domain-containing family O member 2 n=1 Tax=Octodon degus TaxID=10160 RepID=A0A6P6E893_OCTDE|nr:pleckstrin homology domain-containing family O member 2 [Octodon degus]
MARRPDLSAPRAMEEGVNAGGEKPQGARTADKSGWLKKSSGGLLGHWKDRYLLLRHAQLLVCENEDEQKCVETVELSSYEKCQDLRALLKRKHRFILLRSPGIKVSDIKFQAPSGEEKESWIKALNEGINRGKNKAFDEVKVDKTCALAHVTRDRVRGGQRRRPPTRIHLKEVANAASDGLLRLDLDVPDSGPPVLVPSDTGSEAQPQPQPQVREVLMPPPKLSPAMEPASLSDGVAPPEGDKALTPVSASTEAHPESPLDSENNPTEEDSGSKEFCNSTLPDKMKVSWESPSFGDPTVPEELSTVPEEPPAVPEEPSTVPKEPPFVPKKPHVVPEEPPTVPEESPTVLKEPSAILKEPPAVPKKPLAVPEKPPAVPEEPLTVPEEPSAVLKEPPAVPKKPLAVPEKPPTPEKPTTSHNVELSPGPSLKTSEAPRREGRKPPTPPPKFLSEKMKACLGRAEASGPARSLGTPEPCSPVRVSVNGVDDGLEPAKPSPDAGPPGAAPEEVAVSPAQLPLPDASPQLHSRCSSLGDLLTDGRQRPLLPGDRLYRAQLEVQVASKQTERLLGEVLGGQVPPANTETLLSQAVEQLRQATQVLQEMRDSDAREPDQEAPGLQKKQKELVSLYRRSMP